MDFDHREGENKMFSIGSENHKSWPVVLAEIAKCDLVCANCHRLRTAGRAGTILDFRAEVSGAQR